MWRIRSGLRERLYRKYRVRVHLGVGPVFTQPVWSRLQPRFDEAMVVAASVLSPSVLRVPDVQGLSLHPVFLLSEIAPGKESLGHAGH